MNENLIFISYRRADNAPHSLALRLELETRFNDVNVFLDTRQIQTGSIWPNDIESAIQAASVFLILIGPNWLGVREDGTRRIDDPEDWVTREVGFALNNKIGAILPLLIDGAKYPIESDLPDDLKKLVSIQHSSLGVSEWSRDIDRLAKDLEGKFRFNGKSYTYIYPKRDLLKAETLPLDWNKLKASVEDHMPAWSLEFSDDPVVLNHKKIELVRRLEFPSFEEAMQFTRVIEKYASDNDHHPRWMNLWRTLTIWLCTWDAGHQVTSLDIQLARFIDKKYLEALQKKHK